MSRPAARPTTGIWLSTEPADMRRSFDGLSALVATHLGENPARGRWYVVVNIIAGQVGAFCGLTRAA
ncbi:MAG: transposase [Boseongicola sp. SB0677_bin_26]|nr:transposase [Boseongicola sp. SB0677_bin_26]